MYYPRSFLKFILLSFLLVSLPLLYALAELLLSVDRLASQSREEVLQAASAASPLHASPRIDPEPRSVRLADDPELLPLQRARALDDDAIRAAIARFDGNLSAAARHLGVARNTLYRRMGRPF